MKKVLYSRLLVLKALEPSQLSSVDLIHVQISMYLQLILTDAERDRVCMCERETERETAYNPATVTSQKPTPILQFVYVALFSSLKRPGSAGNKQSRAC